MVYMDPVPQTKHQIRGKTWDPHGDGRILPFCAAKLNPSPPIAAFSHSPAISAIVLAALGAAGNWFPAFFSPLPPSCRITRRSPPYWLLTPDAETGLTSSGSDNPIPFSLPVRSALNRLGWLVYGSGFWLSHRFLAARLTSAYL